MFALKILSLQVVSSNERRARDGKRWWIQIPDITSVPGGIGEMLSLHNTTQTTDGLDHDEVEFLELVTNLGKVG